MHTTCKKQFSSKENSSPEKAGRRLIRCINFRWLQQAREPACSTWGPALLFLPTAVTAETGGGSSRDSTQLSASRAGCQGTGSLLPRASQTPLTCEAHGKAHLFSPAFASGIWGKVYFINCASICAGGESSAMSSVYRVFGLSSVAAARECMMSILNISNNENSQ